MAKPRKVKANRALKRIGGGTGAKGRPAQPGPSTSGNEASFNQMLNQYDSLQQQTMLENMKMQKAQAFWNPIETLSKRDATS